ncbi:MAG: hypothetical protein NTW19_18385 [Planctomycetota bacterium]|nr:hypothetical protein [Planctomycetota bacterium]
MNATPAASSSPTKPTPSERRRFDVRVESNEPICREHFRLRMRVERSSGVFPATRPGQFIQLGCRQPDVAADMEALLGAEREWSPGEPLKLTQPELCGPLALLRRPFSLSGRGDDKDGTWLEIIHRVVGVGTDWLSRLRPGDAADLIGPLGNWFELPAGKKRGLLVGGGVGLPPMFYLTEAMKRAGWDAVGFVGALTSDLLAVKRVAGVDPATDGKPARCVEEFARHGFSAVVTTDDGSLGLPGRITLGVERFLAGLGDEQRRETVVYVCGPHVMMHAVAQLAAKAGVDSQACLEQAMACGMGTCQSCVVKIEDRQRPQATTADGTPWRFRLACTDGPVFDGRVVVW